MPPPNAPQLRLRWCFFLLRDGAAVAASAAVAVAMLSAIKSRVVVGVEAEGTELWLDWNRTKRERQRREWHA